MPVGREPYTRMLGCLKLFIFFSQTCSRDQIVEECRAEKVLAAVLALNVGFPFG